MFTRTDYERYFDEIARIERKMIYRTYDLGLELDAFAGLADCGPTTLRKIGESCTMDFVYVGGLP